MIRFIMIGGFLGAGKTTALLRLARDYGAAGLRVGIITNDQADGLVDTEIFRSAGFQAEEIPHGCFCCKFNELVEAAGRLADGHQPDVLLAEPVGSCTDLVATVIKPLKKLYPDRFSIAPYVALLDPARAYKSLTGTGRAGFSAKVTYIYKMQQHEADVVAINKVDTLDPRPGEEMQQLVQRNFPKATVIGVSARTGEGFDRLSGWLQRSETTSRRSPDIDYDTYAAGEAQLGWFNATLELSAERGFDADRLLLDLLQAICDRLNDVGAEPAHVKTILSSGQIVAIANLVGSDCVPELSQACNRQIFDGTLLINARVECSAEVLRKQVEDAVEQILANQHVDAAWSNVESLAPGRPVPTHRIADDLE